MKTVNRLSTFRIDGISRDPDGFLICDARLTKSGVFEYQDAEGKKIRELRPSSEIMNEDSLETYKGAPLTVLHPRTGMVNARNHRLLSVGTVLEAKPALPYVVGRLKITDSAVADRVESGELSEISMGYRADMAPAIDPLEHDYVQRNIMINHCALLPEGKARLGSDVRVMRLDSADNVIIEDILMTKETVERTDAELTEEETKNDASDNEETTSEEAAPKEMAEETDADEPKEEAPAEESEEDKEDAPADEEKAEETSEESETEEAAEEPAEDEPSEEEKEDAAPAWATALDAKLDSILDALKPSEKEDSETEEKTDAKDDDFEKRVQRSVRARVLHSTVLTEEKQDGLSDRELALKVIQRFDSDFEPTEESTDALISMAEWAAKVNREDSTEDGFRSRFRSSIRSGSNKSAHMDALEKILDK